MSAHRRFLPPHPSLDQQKSLAKELLAAYRAGDSAATDLVREYLPDKQRIALADAQFVIAREFGFSNWAALKTAVKSRSRLPRSVRDEFARAFNTRDIQSIRALFERYPDARAMIDAPLFPFGSPALVHFAGSGDIDLINLILDLGADPNRRSDWWAGGFHALHSARGAVAERLLEAGAVPDACSAAQLDRSDLLMQMLRQDPARVHERGGDGQTPLHFARSREVVDLLLAHDADINARDVDHRSTPAQWMLERKRGAGRFALAEYLVEHGAEVDILLAAALGLTEQLRGLLQGNASLVEQRTGHGDYGEQPPSSFHIYTWTIGQHLSPLQVAAQFEQHEAFDILQDFSSPKDRLLAACAHARVQDANELLREWPGLLDDLNAEDMRVLPDAGWAGNAAAVDLMLALSFDAAATGPDGGTVLHCAAWQGAAACIETALRYSKVRALIEVRDRVHGSTPLGWCCHGARYCADQAGDYPAVARLLLEAGARPGPNLVDAPEDVLAVIRSYEPK